MKTYSFAVLALFAIVPLQVTADATLACRAGFEVRAGNERYAFGAFEAHGQCDHESVAECQKSARSYAKACFQQAWSTRSDAYIRAGRYKPSNCLAHGALRVRGYSVSDLEEQVRRAGCAMDLPRPFRVQLIGRTWNGELCGGETHIADYLIRDETCIGS